MLVIQLSLFVPLFASDGQQHFEFVSGSNCDIGYSNALCLATNWLGLSEWQLWGLFFIISLLIPLFLVIYTKCLWLFPVFFVFTGFYWNTMAMQVFAQILFTLFFVFFVFEEKRVLRWFVLGALALLLFFGVRFHNTEYYVLIAVLVFEVISLFNLFVRDLYNEFYVNNSKNFITAVGCGLFPVSVVNRVSCSVNSIREPMNNNVGGFLHKLYYYSYSFFWENMFIGFMVPGVYKIWKDRDFRKIYYLLFVVLGALFLWWLTRFEIWFVTRVIIWLPIILVVPFYEWLVEQKHLTKASFVFVGVAYFVFNVYYFINRIQDMGCP